MITQRWVLVAAVLLGGGVTHPAAAQNANVAQPASPAAAPFCPWRRASGMGMTVAAPMVWACIGDCTEIVRP